MPANSLAGVDELVRLRVDLPGRGAQMLLSSPTSWWEQHLPETETHTAQLTHTSAVCLTLSLLSVSISLCLLPPAPPA